MLRIFLSTCVYWLLLATAPAAAQSPEFYGRSLAAYTDLKFPPAAQDLSLFGSMSNGLFKPAGEGPFPAVVLVHTCGGLQPHITDRAKDLLAAGFLVLVLDSYGPRGHTAYCQPRGVTAPRLYKDTFDALDHLSTLKEVDASKIYLVGLSLGSFAASSVASANVAKRLGSGRRFKASVGWYGSCTFDVSPFPKWRLLHPDTDMPVLLLLARNDTETPIADCFPLLDQMKGEGRPVAWHVYESATHGWDKSNVQRGYVLSRETTKDAMDRTVKFLKEH